MIMIPVRCPVEIVAMLNKTDHFTVDPNSVERDDGRLGIRRELLCMVWNIRSTLHAEYPAHLFPFIFILLARS